RSARSLSLVCSKNVLLMNMFYNFISCTAPNLGSLVYPRLLEERGSGEGRVLKINEDLTLNLKKSSVVADEFLLKSHVGHVAKHEYLDGSYLEEDLYHDADGMASLTVSEDGELQVEGMIGHKWRIKPAPKQERSSDGHLAHRLYEIGDVHSGLYYDYGALWFKCKFECNDTIFSDIYNAKMIYPELFVLVDTAFARQFRSQAKLIKYVSITVNAMNLRYLSVSNPGVKFKLMGLEFLTREKESFLRYIQQRPQAIYGQQSLYALRQFVKDHEATYKPYDLVYMITGCGPFDQFKNSEVEVSPSSDWSYLFTGFAYIGTACGDLKVGLGEDRADTFEGVHVMTHEVAHIMGCPHDGDHSPSHLRGPGSSTCPFSEGYIMSYYVINLNHYKFSHCCNNQISSMSWSPLGRCLHERNANLTLKKKYSRLPGTGHTKTGQCKRAYPQVPETYYMKVLDCEMKCFMPQRVYGHETNLKLKLTDGTKC
ncbi:unnamed protein product, partial [Ixodes hexagonus]